jgi:hypothetical protein
MKVKCSSCGAEKNMDKSQNCDFCGNLIEIEIGKIYYQKAMQSESSNLMAMAETAIEATNWDEALSFYNQVLTKEISNCDAWLGKGIAIVYSSKIGDLKINEAIAYWKNAIKYSADQVAMSKRVAKEINQVVESFYPTLEKHFIQFKGLENSYPELVFRFVTLEGALDYAVKLDPSNISYSKNGYELCNRVIDIPNLVATASKSGALAGLSGNKLLQYEANNKFKEAQALKKKIKEATDLVFPLREKYFNNIKALDPSTNLVNSPISTGSKKSSGCFIATATMGNYDHPVVMDLRMFRDNWLLKREWGKKFTNWYYTYSPKVARVIEKSTLLKKVTFILIVKPLQIITKKFI